MVNVSLTVKEIVAIMQSTGRDFDDLYDKLLKALEDAIVVPQVNSEPSPKSSSFGGGILYLHTIPQDQKSFLNAVKIIRSTSGISLFDAKTFCDKVRGNLVYTLTGAAAYEHGRSNSMELSVTDGYEIANGLKEIGCDAVFCSY